MTVSLATLAQTRSEGAVIAIDGTNGIASDDSGTLVINSDVTLTGNNEYILTDVTYVEGGATLTIEPGTIIRGEAKNSDSFDPGTIVVTRDGKIHAVGTRAEPIIFTTAAIDNGGDGVADSVADVDGDGRDDPAVYADGDTFLDADPVNSPLPVDRGLDSAGEPINEYRGLWGGIIVLGEATTNVDRSAEANSQLQAGENFIEGLPDPSVGGDRRGVYGGTDDEDNSGTIRWVSIRHGGTNLAQDNEINGLTLGAVGRGTTIEYVEVYANLDDGIEFFGGTVDTKYMVMVFNNDDSYDIDEGFRGRGQYWFSLHSADGTNGEHGGEHDGGTKPQDGTPLTYPVVFNATYIGGGTGAVSDNAGFQIRDNFGGQYSNSIFTEFPNEAIEIESDGDTPARFNVGEIVFTSNIWWNFAYNTTSGAYTNTVDAMGGEWNGTSAVAGDLEDALWTDAAHNNMIADPGLHGIGRREMGSLDPRPSASGPAVTITLVDEPDSFYVDVSFAGAFDPAASRTWLDGWTVLSKRGILRSEGPPSMEPEEGDYSTGEEIPGAPTGDWTPDILSRASFSQVSGQTAVTFSHGGRIEEEGFTYTCLSSGGCMIEGISVVTGTVKVSMTGGMSPLMLAGKGELKDPGTMFMGHTYNGFELRGSTVTLSATAGEVTRLSFLDINGDVIFVDFSSDSSDTEVVVTLEDYMDPLSESPYNQPDSRYAMGLATVTVVNPTEMTWLKVTSIGNDETLVDPMIVMPDSFATANGWAEIRKIVIEGMGSIGAIHAANVSFRAMDGVVGIDAPDTVVVRALSIGDLTLVEGGTAKPYLKVSGDSLAVGGMVIEEIRIHGGDLAQSTGDDQVDTGGAIFKIMAVDGLGTIDAMIFPAKLDTFVADPDEYFITNGQMIVMEDDGMSSN